MNGAIRVAVLTVSDGVHHGTRIDTAGPAVVGRLRAAGFTVGQPEVVPDERTIAAWLRAVISGSAGRRRFYGRRHRRCAQGRDSGGGSRRYGTGNSRVWRNDASVGAGFHAAGQPLARPGGCRRNGSDRHPAGIAQRRVGVD